MSVVAAKSYIEYQNGSYWIAETRISLDSVVYAFRDGRSPESTGQAFPFLALEQVYGAIAFYLANHINIDAYLTTEEVEFDNMPQPLQTTTPALYKKLIAAKTHKYCLVCKINLKHDDSTVRSRVSGKERTSMSYCLFS